MSWFRPPYTGVYNSVYEWQGPNFSECGPAALTVIARQRHKSLPINRHKCRALCPSPSWWFARNIVMVAKELSIPADIKPYKVGRYAGIYLSNYWGFGHWVVAWLRPDGKIQVIDPKRGAYTSHINKFESSLKSTRYVDTDVIFK